MQCRMVYASFTNRQDSPFSSEADASKIRNTETQHDNSKPLHQVDSFGHESWSSTRLATKPATTQLLRTFPSNNTRSITIVHCAQTFILDYNRFLRSQNHSPHLPSCIGALSRRSTASPSNQGSSKNRKNTVETEAEHTTSFKDFVIGNEGKGHQDDNLRCHPSSLFINHGASPVSQSLLAIPCQVTSHNGLRQSLSTLTCQISIQTHVMWYVKNWRDRPCISTTFEVKPVLNTSISHKNKNELTCLLLALAGVGSIDALGLVGDELLELLGGVSLRHGDLGGGNLDAHLVVLGVGLGAGVLLVGVG
eukprot:765212-Hanusia_phi.AAC.1